MKFRESSIWHNRVLEVHDPRTTNNGGAWEKKVKSNVTAPKQQSKKNTDWISPGQKRKQGVLLVQAPPSIPAQKSDRELGGPWERLLLSSLVQSLGLGTRLTAEAPEIRWVRIHATCTSSASSGCTSHSNNQLHCCSFPLHATACCCSSLLHAMHCLLRLAPQCNAFC